MPAIPTTTRIQFGDGLTVIDLGSGIIRVDGKGSQGPQGPAGPTGPTGPIGNLRIVTNTSQLPASPNNNDLAFIMVEDSPIPLVYNSTLGKWVSEIQHNVSGYPGTQAGPTWSGNSAAPGVELSAQTTAAFIGSLPYRLYDAVGLYPQVRLSGAVSATSPPNNAILQASYATANVSAVIPAASTAIVPQCAISNSVASYPFKDSGWKDVLPTPTLADWIWFSCRLYNTAGVGATARSVSIDVRWLNK